MSPRSKTGRRAGIVLGAVGGLMLAGTGPAGAAIPPPSNDTQVAEVVEDMSLEELVGQMTWTHVYGSSAHDTSMAASNQDRYGVNTPAEVIEKYDLGGVLYFAWSNLVVVDDPEGTAELSNGLQEVSTGEEGSGIPLAVTIDQEGGLVARIGAPATVFPGNMALGATFNEDLAYAQGEILGEELGAMGINVNFAPVVDVNTNPDNPVIGVRSLGEDPQAVAALGVAQIEGMQDNNVAATAKHFPGHGDTATDSHTGLPIVTYDRATLEEHLLPFQAAIDAGVDMIMTAHIIVEAIDPTLPGTLSYDVLTGLLRNEMGFEGLITTDALDMAALKELPDMPLDDGDIAAMAVQAGSDILLNSPDVDASIQGVLDAVTAGDITRERLEESVTRILEWKLERGVWETDPMVDVDAVLDVVGDPDHLATAAQIAERSITLVRNEGDVLPLGAGDDVFVTGWGASTVPALAAALETAGADATAHGAAFPTESQVDAAVAAAAGHDAIVITTMTPASATNTARQQALIDALAATGIPVVQVAVRNPYDVAWDGPDAALAVYGYQAPTLTATARVVMGEVNPAGRLPVNVPEVDGEGVLYELGFGLHYPVDTDDVTFTDRPGRGQDSYTIPETQGVDYRVNGQIVEPGTYRSNVPVTITATPQAGYELADGAVTEWESEFTTGNPGKGGPPEHAGPPDNPGKRGGRG